MATVEQHYQNLLGPIYVWMMGGIDAALRQGANEISSYPPRQGANPVAIDLGAGFGMHAIPLARTGYDVMAFETSEVLLAEMRTHAQGLNIQAINADLLSFREHMAVEADLIVCMGDTITHLQELAQVERLFEEVARALAPAGRMIITFRDYTSPPMGDARFIPVRSDADRIHTCFLEQAGEHMVVHDLLHERNGTMWSVRVSSYRKLRISSEWMLKALDRAGLKAVIEAGPRGMLRVVAVAAEPFVPADGVCSR